MSDPDLASIPPPSPDELDKALGWQEPGEPRTQAQSGHGQAVRAVLEIILQARTPQSARIRAELLRRMAEGTGAAETLPALAKRLGVSARRLEQARRELLATAFPKC